MAMPAERLTKKIRELIARDAASLVDFASALIRVRTENPAGAGAAYAECADLITSRLAQMGLVSRVVDPVASIDRNCAPAPSIVSAVGSGGRALYFHGHYDVVPAQHESQFEPSLRRGTLYGRGAADMKGGIAALTFAVRALVECGFEPAGRLVLLLVPDEETSGSRGTVALAAAGLLEPDAIGMLTPEPTGGVVWNANRGAISLRVTVRGRPAHVGLHFRGVNAFRGMLEVASQLAAVESDVTERRTSYEIRPEAARRSIMMLGGELSGGRNFNVVPDAVSFSVDRRINPEEDLEVERRRLLEVVEESRARGVDVGVEVLQEGRSSGTPADSVLARTLGSAIREVTGRQPRVELCPGLLEIRHYAAVGIPALAYGPGSLSVAHGPKEAVAVRRLVECATVYGLAAARLLS